MKNSPQTFEFAIHNQSVIEALAKNQEHHIYADCWANQRRFFIQAEDVESATKKMSKKYADDEGFVVVLIR